jgi:hypothetical protein
MCALIVKCLTLSVLVETMTFSLILLVCGIWHCLLLDFPCQPPFSLGVNLLRYGIY